MMVILKPGPMNLEVPQNFCEMLGADYQNGSFASKF
jgi:hypothetical protein